MIFGEMATHTPTHTDPKSYRMHFYGERATAIAQRLEKVHCKCCAFPFKSHTKMFIFVDAAHGHTKHQPAQLQARANA